MLPKTAEYALRAAVWLAGGENRIESADALAERTKIPRRYLHKVLQDLARGGLVRSQPGPGGGYALNRSPEKISILDVVNAVAPLERIRSCPLGLPSHTRLCPLHRELDQVYANAEESLKNVTLAQLLRSTSTIVPLCDVAEMRAV
ncbi:MAG: Rrf2 family transcriptional regulator [Pirellulales bacterium]|nr:Rrf2 family transcriptional regulator [Pirellulales bacterium]